VVVVVFFVVGFLGFLFQALLWVLVVLFSGLYRRGRRWRLYAFKAHEPFAAEKKKTLFHLSETALTGRCFCEEVKRTLGGVWRRFEKEWVRVRVFSSFCFSVMASKGKLEKKGASKDSKEKGKTVIEAAVTLESFVSQMLPLIDLEKVSFSHTCNSF
jgi:hypothetical protein